MWRAFCLLCSLVVAGSGSMTLADDPQWVIYEGTSGPGKGKHIVLISGDEEYRSEEGLPQLGKILALHHGFRCVVLFAIDQKSGEINPNESSNIPGLDALATADLMIIATRFRDLPDDQMKKIVDFIESGKPIIGLRTATHAFNTDKHKTFAKYTWTGKEPGYEGGFGKQVLGETWVNHHGHHGKEATRGRLAPDAKENPILRGIADKEIFGPTDVYGVHLPLPGDSKPLVLGEVVGGMKPTDPAVEGEKNNPMMPVAWTKSYKSASGKTARVFTTTMGAATDLENEALRRLLVNAAYWCLEIESQIPPKSNVDIVGEYKPLPFGFNGFKKGVKPAQHAL